ncbi:hypothetical protein GCM10010492_50770 [Saccharothrix mutabilis subsp. mutabilis]|uniref:Uncharacterized protein n=1 Tax=Saccharothrix mutabilis subsp. mutabilis TaxID=66855 RepID=A0ABP3E091_9PSEU
MEFVLYRVSQPGTSRRRRSLREVAMVTDDHGVLAWLFQTVHDRPGVPMLKRVDPYRDLEFTSAEMEQLIAELDQVAPSADEFKGGLETVRAVRALAQRCLEDPELVVRFVGD